jgi:AbrB family looped-hinge helix DNA binding protein
VVRKIVNHGMINIPAQIRKKYRLKDGDEVLVMDEDDGYIKLVILESIESIREKSFTAEEIMEELNKARDMELELEK